MAKKKVKKTKKVKPVTVADYQDSLKERIEKLAKAGFETVGLVKEVDAKVIALEQRIDHIVSALDKSKSVRGL